MGRKVLVLSKNYFKVDKLTDILNRNDFSVKHLEKHYLSKSEYEKERPDIIILDISDLRDVHIGEELMEISKECRVILSANIRQSDIVSDIVSKGIREFIVTPYIEENIIRVLAG